MSSSARSRAEGPATNSRELQPSARGAKLRPADVCDVEPCDAVQPCFVPKPAERTQVWTNCGPPLREASARRRLRRRALRRGATLLRSEACGAHAGLDKLRASAAGGFGPPTSATSSPATRCNLASFRSLRSARRFGQTAGLRCGRLRPADVCDVEPCDAVQPCFVPKPAERSHVC